MGNETVTSSARWEPAELEAQDVDAAVELLTDRGLTANVMIDFSHANSSKQFSRQLQVGENVADQIATGDRRIMGVMIESHLVEGRQDIVEGQKLCTVKALLMLV